MTISVAKPVPFRWRIRCQKIKMQQSTMNPTTNHVNIFIYKKQFYKNQLTNKCVRSGAFVCAHLIGWDIDQSDELKFSERIEILNLRIY